jgi:predicted GNAT family acetyltransferase
MRCIVCAPGKNESSLSSIQMGTGLIQQPISNTKVQDEVEGGGINQSLMDTWMKGL